MFFGGLPIAKDEATLKDNCPHIVVGTPGRLLALASKKSLKLTNIKHFVLDECDQMLEKLGKLKVPFISTNFFCPPNLTVSLVQHIKHAIIVHVQPSRRMHGQDILVF